MTKIEWTNETLNIITGCTKYSEGCQNCYAEKMHKRLTAMGQIKYKEPFNKIVCHNIRKEFKKVITKNTKKIFINSMSDTFHKDVPTLYIGSLLYEISNFENINFQILTKRAERIKHFEYPDNIWLGVTVEMAKYKNRIECLKETNAKVKFLSCEPLLEDLGELDLKGIDWVIVGGESGHNARPMHPDWVRNIQKQCQKQGVPFFFKQWGEWRPIDNTDEMYFDSQKTKIILNDGSVICGIFPKDVKNFETETGKDVGVLKGKIVYKFGKSKAGCLLDGKEYKEYPKKYEVKNV